MESFLTMIISLQLPSCFIWEEDNKINLNGKDKSKKSKEENSMVKGDTMHPTVHIRLTMKMQAQTV